MRASVPHRMRCPRHILVAAVLLLCLAASFSTATAAPSAAGEASPAQGVRSTTQNGGVADEKKTEEEELDPRAPVEHINCRACTTMAFLFFEEAMRPATTRYGVYLRSRKNVAGGAVRERLPSEQADVAASSLSGPMTKELPHFFRDRMVAELHESVDGLCERLSNFHGVLRKHLEMEVDMLSDLDEDLHSTSHQGQIYAAKRQLFVDGEVGNACGEVLEEVDEALSSTAFEALLPSRFPTSDKPSSSSSSSSLDEDVNQLAEESSESWSFTFCTRHALCTAEQRSSILTSGSTPLAPRYEQSQRPAPAYVSKKKRLQQEQQQKKKHKKKTAASAPAEAKTKRVKAESRGSSSTMIGGVAVAVMAVVVGLAWRLTQKPAPAPPPSASSSPWPAAAKEMVPAEEKPPELPAATSSE